MASLYATLIIQGNERKRNDWFRHFRNWCQYQKFNLPEKDQIFIYSSTELELIKNTFADNDELLYAVRNVLLQFPLSDAQKTLIKNQVTPAVFAVLKKRILPDIGPEFPLGQIPSLLTTLTDDLKNKSDEDMAVVLESKSLQKAYLEQQFDVLSDIDNAKEPEITIKKLEASLESDLTLTGKRAQLSAFLFILGYIDPMLRFIKSIAGEKSETPEEQKARLKRDSSK